MAVTREFFIRGLKRISQDKSRSPQVRGRARELLAEMQQEENWAGQGFNRRNEESSGAS